jgi:hypothetical protein
MATAKDREEARQLYEDGGESIGYLLCCYPEMEPEIWKMVAGAGIWRRKDLAAFKSIWRLEHPNEYGYIKRLRYVRRKSRKDRAAKLKEMQSEGSQKIVEQRKRKEDF